MDELMIRQSLGDCPVSLHEWANPKPVDIPSPHALREGHRAQLINSLVGQLASAFGGCPGQMIYSEELANEVAALFKEKGYTTYVHPHPGNGGGFMLIINR